MIEIKQNINQLIVYKTDDNQYVLRVKSISIDGNEMFAFTKNDELKKKIIEIKLK